MSMLSCRVIDCTDERGQLAGFMLAQLGADVVLLEPPAGSPSRHLPPFAGDRPGPERGLWHWAYNRGKRSVTADLSSAAGRDRLAELTADADVLLWTGSPQELPFSPAELAERNPRLVAVVLTSFGLDGPKAGWAGSDLIISAAGCGAALMGNADLPPLRWGSPQAYLHGAADMAVAALVALAERERSGLGQLADVSAQVSCIQSSFCYTLNAAWGVPAMRRNGDGIDFGAYRARWTYPTLDGEVTITVSFGVALQEYMRNLFTWIWEEGGCDEATRDSPWAELGGQLASGAVPAGEADRLCDVIAAFTARHTKAQLAEQARRRKVLLAPIATLDEVLDNDHLAARRYWDVVTHPENPTAHRHPGRFVVAPAAPLAVLGPAPVLGSHDHDGAPAAVAARDRWPRTAAEAPAGRGAGTAGGTAAGSGDATALGGLKVLDLAWSVAGPYVGRLLADFGATVVHVESHTRPDVARSSPPFHPASGSQPYEGTVLHANTNAGKLGLDLDLTRPTARDVCLDLVRWADVVVESFSAGALERMGIGYERMRAVNPGIILLSSCLPGQTGTLDMPGLGNLTTALFGFTSTSRWPGRPAAGPFGAYTDIVSPRFGIAAVLAALQHRRRTGEGQHLDLSQAEASLHLQAAALLDAEVNGRALPARGNRDSTMAPHGVYPAAGEDRWVAIACTDDAAWWRLAGRAGLDDAAHWPLEQRLARQDELDARLAAWTAERDPVEVQDELQAIGVAAHQVQNSAECLADPQLAHRGHYVRVEHPILGPVTVEGPRFWLSRTPGATVRPGPTYGQDADRVLRHLLGYDEARIAELTASGALGSG
jgi:crotonobetainyl-CoA:carnitine CoA-transferase CaiB-like acyl-CoA transferase